MNLNNTERELFKSLLDQLAHELACAGCNDMQVPSNDETVQLLLSDEVNPEGTIDLNQSSVIVNNSAVLCFLRKKLRL